MSNSVWGTGDSITPVIRVTEAQDFTYRAEDGPVYFIGTLHNPNAEELLVDIDGLPQYVDKNFGYVKAEKKITFGGDFSPTQLAGLEVHVRVQASSVVNLPDQLADPSPAGNAFIQQETVADMRDYLELGTAATQPLTAFAQQAHTHSDYAPPVTYPAVSPLTKFWRGDGTWNIPTPFDGNLAASLVFSGAGRRISGDFSSNPPVTDRTLFQTNVSNSPSYLTVIPSGTGIIAAFEAISSSDSANGQSGRLQVNAGDAVRVISMYRGTPAVGTYLPVYISTGNADRWSFDTNGVFKPLADNAYSVGTASNRASVVYAGSGSINTSDARHKTPVRNFSINEIAAAKLLAREIGFYRFLTAIAEKGETLARVHCGMTVQRVIEIMEGCGLDPMEYGFICYDSWGAHTVYDSAGTPVEIPAGDIYSFRMDELAMFIIRGIEERISQLEGV